MVVLCNFTLVPLTQTRGPRTPVAGVCAHFDRRWPLCHRKMSQQICRLSGQKKTLLTIINCIVNTPNHNWNFVV